MRTTPPLPTSIWVLAWILLAGQVVQVFDTGFKETDGVSLVGSVVIGLVLVPFIAAGVIRARTVRLVLAWIIVGLLALLSPVALFRTDGTSDFLFALADVATGWGAAAALHAFAKSDWFAWQRTKPASGHGDSIAGLMLIAVIGGALGGVIGPEEPHTGANVHIRF